MPGCPSPTTATAPPIPAGNFAHADDRSADDDGHDPPDLANPYFVELSTAVQTAVEARGSALVILNHGDDVGHQRLLMRDLRLRGIDHLLLVAPVGQLDDIAASGMSVAVLDHTDPIKGITILGANSEAGAAEAVRHLLEVHGHNTVTIALGEQKRFGACNGEQGWRRALQENEPFILAA